MYSVVYFSNAEDNNEHIYKHKEYFFCYSNACDRIEYIKKFHKPCICKNDYYGDLKPHIVLTESASIRKIYNALFNIKETYEYC